MTHHNQIKELTTWFLNLPLDESIDNKNKKFEVWIQNPMKHIWKTKKPRKVQEGHLEEGTPQKPTKGTKSGKTKQNGKSELRKSSEEQERLKTKAKAQNQHSPWNQLPLKLSMKALPLR
jgi:hypothetical protein